jgi:TonB family protein
MYSTSYHGEIVRPPDCPPQGTKTIKMKTAKIINVSLLVSLLLIHCTPIIKMRKPQRKVAGIKYGYDGKKTFVEWETYAHDSTIKSLSKDTLKRCTGKRSQASVLRSITSNISSIRDCYNNRRKENANLFGSFLVRFSIDSAGQVQNCNIVYSSMMDTMFENEVKGKFEKMTFEPSSDNDTNSILYPIKFEGPEHNKREFRYRGIDAGKTGPRETKHLYYDLKKLKNLLKIDWCNEERDTIKGYVVLRMRIDPVGHVDSVCLIDNQLNDKEYSDKFVSRISSFKFRNEKDKESTFLKWIFLITKEDMICPKKRSGAK